MKIEELETDLFLIQTERGVIRTSEIFSPRTEREKLMKKLLFGGTT
jgi:hypothetical protein